MNKTLSTLIGASALAVGVSLATTTTPVFAFGVTGGQVTNITAADIGDTFTVNFDGNVETQDVTGLSATATFSLFSFTNNQVVFDIALTNTSSSPITGSRVSVLGFDTDPNVSSASSSGIFNTAVLGSELPNEFGSIEVCFKDGGGPNNCQGAGNGGVTLGNTGNFRTTLNFSNNGGSIDLSNFGVRYQSITGTTLGTSGTGQGTPDPNDTNPEPVPEPFTIIGSGIALGFGTYLKRKMDKQKAKA